jgi:hypothetical protein
VDGDQKADGDGQHHDQAHGSHQRSVQVIEQEDLVPEQLEAVEVLRPLAELQIDDPGLQPGDVRLDGHCRAQPHDHADP